MYRGINVTDNFVSGAAFPFQVRKSKCFGVAGRGVAGCAWGLRVGAHGGDGVRAGGTQQHRASVVVRNTRDIKGLTRGGEGRQLWLGLGCSVGGLHMSSCC